MFNPMLNSRRDILWNIKEPGDPYDITKSMIQKLPGEEKIFMGDNLELVCLFQAAEIERLTLYLNEYVLKYREIERKELDRHSYEEMIKELTEKWNMADLERKEKNETINKLRDFVQKQSNELEDLKKYSKDQVLAKYEEALKQLEEYRRENSQLKEDNIAMSRDIEQLRVRLSQLEYQLEKYPPQQSYNVEIEQLKFRYETEIRGLEIERQRFQEENFGLRNKLEQLDKLVLEYRTKDSAREALLIERSPRLESEISRLQNTIAILRQENERLGLVEREKSAETIALKNQLRLREEEVTRFRSESSEIASKFQSQEARIHELEDNIRDSRYQQSSEQEQLIQANRKMEKTLTELYPEIERLNNLLRLKVNQIEQYEKRLKDYEYEFSRIEIIKRENDTSRSRIEEMGRKLSEYENKIALLSQEIERLNIELRRRKGEDQSGEDKSRFILRENEELKSRLSMLSSRIEQDNRSYEESIQKLRRESEENKIRSETYSRKLSEYEGKMTLMSQEIERLNAVLDRTLREKDALSRLGPEIGSVRSTYEARVQNLTAENEEFRRRLQEYAEKLQKVEEYERKLTSLSMEVKRLNEVLAIKLEEIKGLSNLIHERESENEILKSQLSQSSNQSSFLVQQKEAELMTLRRQLETMTAQLRQFQDENNSYRQSIRDLEVSSRDAYEMQQKLVTLSQEVQRLNDVLTRIKQENEQLKTQSRYISEYETRVSMFESKTATYERQVETISSQLEQSESARRDLESRLGQQSSDLQRKLFESEQKLSSLKIELEHKNRYLQELEQNINESGLKLRESDRSISEYTSKMVIMSKEIERLNDVIQRVSQDSDQTKSKIQQYSAYEQQVEREMQENRRKLSDYENKIAMFSQEIERLNHNLEDKIRELNNVQVQLKNSQHELNEIRYKLQVTEGNRGDEEQRSRRAQEEIQRLTQIIHTHESKITEITTTIQQYHEKLVVLSQENQRLGGGVQESEQTKRKLTDDYSRLEQAHQSLKHEHDELLKRLTEYENKMGLMSQEIQRLNGLLQKITSENEELRGNLSLNTQKLNAELNAAHRTITDFELRISIFNQERDRLEELLRNSEQEKSELMIKYQTSTRDGDRWNEEVNLYKRKIGEYEEQMRRLSQEIERLTGLLQRSTSESQELSIKVQSYTRLEQQLRSTSEDKDRQIIEYQNKVALLSQELERLNMKYSEEYGQTNAKIQELMRKEQKLNAEIDNLEKKLTERENNATVMGSEITRLNETLESKVREINTLKQQITQLTKELEELRYKLRTSEETAYAIESTHRQSILEIERLTRIINDNSLQSNQFQERARQYIEEIERLNNTLRIKVEETRRWEQRCAELENMLQSEGSQWRAKYDEVLLQFNNEKQQHRTLQDAYQRLLSEYEKSKSSLKEYEIMIQKLNQEFNRLQEIIRGQKIKCEEYDRFREQVSQHDSESQLQIKVLQEEVLRLRKEIQQSEDHARGLAEHRCQELDLQKRVQEHLSLFVVLFAEIESLRNRLISKEVEVENVRRSSLAPFMPR